MRKKISMNRRKRKRKWPYVAGIFLTLGVLYVSVAKLEFKKTGPQPLAESYNPVTWDKFTDYQRLEMLLQGFAVGSIIDTPFVHSEILKKPFLKNIRYFGIANSEDQARALQIQYGSKLRTFLNREVTIDVLPKADLILCWDQLCALTPNEVRAAILQFKKSGAQFLLMRHYPDVQQNLEKLSGEFKPVNWAISPYNFPEPIIHIMEKGEHGMESLALWNLDQL